MHTPFWYSLRKGDYYMFKLRYGIINHHGVLAKLQRYNYYTPRYKDIIRGSSKFKMKFHRGTIRKSGYYVMNDINSAVNDIYKLTDFPHSKFYKRKDYERTLKTRMNMIGSTISSISTDGSITEVHTFTPEDVEEMNKRTAEEYGYE